MSENKTTTPSVELISGAYSSWLWNEVESTCDEQAPEMIHNVLNTLYECGKIDDAYQFVSFIHDMLNLELPDEVVKVCENPEGRKSYIVELLMDIADMI